MSIVAQCQHCSQKYRLNAGFTGKSLKCKKCGNRISVSNVKAADEFARPAPRQIRPRRPKVAVRPRKERDSGETAKADVRERTFTIVAVAAGSIVALSLFVGIGVWIYKASQAAGDGRIANSASPGDLKYDGYTARQWLKFVSRSDHRFERKQFHEASAKLPLDPSMVETMIDAVASGGFERGFATDYLRRFGPEELAGQGPMLAARLTDRQPEVRAISVYLLGVLGEEAREFSEAIVPLARDADSSVRSAAFRSLTRIGGEAGVAGLTAMLNDPNLTDSERLPVLESLASQRVESAVEPLIVMLNAPEIDGMSRTRVVAALGRVGSPQALDELVELASDENEKDEMRSSAVKAIGKIGHESAFASLERLITESPSDAKIQVALIESLASWKPDEAGKASQVMESLADLAIQGQSELQRIAAIRSIARFGDAAFATLQTTLADSSETIRIATLAAVSKSGPKAEPLLPDLQEVLVKFGKRPQANAGTRSSRLLSREDREAEALATALFGIGPPAIPVLALGLEHDRREIRLRALRRLTEMKVSDDAVLARISSLVRDSDSRVSDDAVVAVGRLSHEGITIPAVNADLIAVVNTAKGMTNRIRRQMEQEPAELPDEIPGRIPLDGRPRRSRTDDLTAALRWAIDELGKRGKDAAEAKPALEAALDAISKLIRELENDDLLKVGSIKIEIGYEAMSRDLGQGRSVGGLKYGQKIVTDINGNVEMTIYDLDEYKAKARVESIRDKIDSLRKNLSDLRTFENSLEKALSGMA